MPHPCLAPQLLGDCLTDPRAWSLPGRNALFLGAGSEPAHVAIHGDMTQSGLLPPVWDPTIIQSDEADLGASLAELKLIPKPSAAVPELSRPRVLAGPLRGDLAPTCYYCLCPHRCQGLSPSLQPPEIHPECTSLQNDKPCWPSPKFLTTYGPSQQPAVNSLTRARGPRSCSSKGMCLCPSWNLHVRTGGGPLGWQLSVQNPRL